MTGRLADRRRMIAAAEDFALTSQSVGDWYVDDDEATHIHEAGHAVAASLLGIEFHHVSVAHQDDRQSNGRVEFYETPYDWIRRYGKPDIARALNGCITLMAGMAAQLRLQGDDSDLKVCGAGDREKLDGISPPHR